MRRLLGFLLLATVGLPLWAPLLALGQPPGASLPACCRRDGKHHCAMGMAAMGESASAAEQVPAWKAPRERCPFCPGSVSAAYHHEVGSTASTQPAFAYVAAHPLGPIQTESKRRVSRDRSRQKRGPPFSLLA